MRYWSGSVPRETAEPLLQLYEALVARGATEDDERQSIVQFLENNELELALSLVLAGASAEEVTDDEKHQLAAIAACEGWPRDAPMTPPEYVERALRFRPNTTDVFPRLT